MDRQGRLEKTVYEIEERLKNCSSAAIAFSGGVDSTFLLAVAKRAGLEKLCAIMVQSLFVPDQEIVFAEKIARETGVNLISLRANILENKEVIKNSKERCYYCKKQIFSMIRDKAVELGYSNFLHAVNLDDLGDYRPGLKAAEELGFEAPLADMGYTKADIRRLSKEIGLETWNKPSQSCLATRIPYGTEISEQDLLRIQKAEAFLQKSGFEQVRVRCHKNMARIEVPEEKIELFFSTPLREKVSKAFRQIGFTYTSIDIDGYKTGKMNNEVL